VIWWVAVSVGKLREALREKVDVLVNEKDAVKVTVGWTLAVPVRLSVADVMEPLHVEVARDWVTEYERVPDREKVRVGARVMELLRVGVEDGREACCVIVLGLRVDDGDWVTDRLPVRESKYDAV